MNSNVFVVIGAVVVALVFILNMVFILTRYRKVGPNQMLIVSGRKIRLPDGSVVGFRVVRGGGTFVFPIIERADVLSLEVLTVELPRMRARAADGAGVEVDCTAQVKINSDDASIVPATECFLGKTATEIKTIVRPVLEKHVALVLAESTVESVTNNPMGLATAVQTSASEDLKKMGMGVVSITLRNGRRA